MSELELKKAIINRVEELDKDALQQVYLLLDQIKITDKSSLEAAYAEMANDENRESEALEWSEGTLNHDEI